MAELRILDRKRLEITGIKEIFNAGKSEVILNGDEGTIVVLGKRIRLLSSNNDKVELIADRIDTIDYN